MFQMTTSEIPPSLDLLQLAANNPKFVETKRISWNLLKENPELFDRLVFLHVITLGRPLVIDGVESWIDRSTFTSQWLQRYYSDKVEQAWDLDRQQNELVSIGQYMSDMPKRADQWTSRNKERRRIYLKDIDCPHTWHEKLKERVPPSLFYLNENVSNAGCPTSSQSQKQDVARAGDLMSCLPPPIRTDNLMCYIGYEGTYTPAHWEICASLGHNLMVEASGCQDELGKATEPGSSIWFMTETKDRNLVSGYWQRVLKHNIIDEDHFANLRDLGAAPFTTYIVDQRVGDFVLIPPLAPHQVWNRGTRTIKVAWNRTTVETLQLALDETLPCLRTFRSDEQYKTKAMVYFALKLYSARLEGAGKTKEILQLQEDFRRLFILYSKIYLSEDLGFPLVFQKEIEYLPYSGLVTCSYCHCNIFNRFLTSTCCVQTLENGDEDEYDLCIECVVLGRSCCRRPQRRWVEQFCRGDLEQNLEIWQNQINAF